MDTTTRAAADQPRSRTNTRTNTHGVHHRATRRTVLIVVAAAVTVVTTTAVAAATVAVAVAVYLYRRRRRRRRRRCSCSLLSTSGASLPPSPFLFLAVGPARATPIGRGMRAVRRARRNMHYTSLRRANRRAFLRDHVIYWLSRSLMFWFTCKQASYEIGDMTTG